MFEELGIHHMEHKVPAKVLKSLEDKARKATAKNTTVAAEMKKRRGLALLRLSARGGRPRLPLSLPPLMLTRRLWRMLAEALPPWMLGRKAKAPPLI